MPLIDQLLDANIRPILEIGLMPQVLAEKDSTVFWWRMYNSMPKKIDEWFLLIQNLVQHLTDRYGVAEIEKWYFEVWNEPNHPAFFSESNDKEAYFKLYDAAAAAVKSINKNYKIGGPATAGLQWIPEMISHCKENDIPLDFVSSHHYGVRGDFDADGKKALWLCPVNTVSGGIRNAANHCKKENIPFFVTEWSSSFSNRDAIHDNYINAPLLLHELRQCAGYVDSMSYWTYTDIFEESGPPIEPFHGGFGMLNIQSIPKPSYHVYTMLNRLGDTQLVCEDIDCYVCKSQDEVQVLFWNVKLPVQDVGDEVFYKRRLETSVLPDAKVVLSGLEADTEYSVEIQTIGYESGDAYEAYLDGDFTKLPTREQTLELIKKSQPETKNITVKANSEGIIELLIPQTENQVDMLNLKF